MRRAIRVSRRDGVDVASTGNRPASPRKRKRRAGSTSPARKARPRRILPPLAAISAGPGPQPGGQQPVEVVDRDLAAHAEPPCPVGAAAQTLLHVLAHAHVLELDLVAELHALLREPERLLTAEVGEVEADDHPPAFGP